MDEDDIKNLVEWAQQRTKENGDQISDATINAYKQVIKRFWRWMYELPQGEHPEMTEWINTSTSKSQKKLPTDLLTRDDIEALKEATRNDRDRAFVAVLYETGARIGELIDLKVGDIEEHRHGRKVVIDGKTGSRRLPLIESSPALNDWLSKHPSGERDDPLWCQLQDSGSELSYNYIRQKLLERAKDRAGIEKPVNPHQFRHSRASDLANKFTEAQLCEWFGWVQGSDIPARYVHLSGRDIDDAYMGVQGLKTLEQEEEERSVWNCWRCEALVETSRKFCGECGAPRDPDTMAEVEDLQEEGEDLVLDVETEAEAKLLRSIQREIREHPEEYFVDED